MHIITENQKGTKSQKKNKPKKEESEVLNSAESNPFEVLLPTLPSSPPHPHQNITSLNPNKTKQQKDEGEEEEVVSYDSK